MRPRNIVSSCLHARRRAPIAVVIAFALGACNDVSSTGPASAEVHAVSLALTERLTIREQGATATLGTVSGCVVTETSVLAVERATKPEAGSSPEVEVFLDATVSDLCTGRIMDRIDTLGSAVTFTADLSGATLTGSLAIRNSIGELRDLPVALTWTGAGDITKGKTTVTIENAGGGTLIVLRAKGSSRAATLSGTIDGQNVSSTVGSATLFDAAEGTISITR